MYNMTHVEIDATTVEEGNEVDVNTLVLVVSWKLVDVLPPSATVTTGVLNVVMSVTVVSEGVGVGAFAAAC